MDKDELRAATVEDRWLKLVSLFKVGKQLGFVSESESKIEVWERWAFLRKSE